MRLSPPDPQKYRAPDEQSEGHCWAKAKSSLLSNTWNSTYLVNLMDVSKCYRTSARISFVSVLIRKMNSAELYYS